jgi:hypothetical protein
LPRRRALPVSLSVQPTSGAIARPPKPISSSGVVRRFSLLRARADFCAANGPSAKVHCSVMGQVGTFCPTRSHCDRFALQKAQHGLAGMGDFANQLRRLCNLVKRGATSLAVVRT